MQRPAYGPDVLDDLGPLYHDFSLFGVANRQLPGIYRLNQQAKLPTLAGYVALAIGRCRTRIDTPVTFAELFCADGYYAMLAARLGCTRCLAIDNDREGHLETGRRIARRLGLSAVEFLEADISGQATFPSVDVVANVGGLYHVSDPRQVLEMSCVMARRFLIVQSVVSLANDDPDYFESPAPGWTWGSRFSRASFDRLIADLGCPVIDHHFNELEGNDRPQDRGSVYYLLRV